MALNFKSDTTQKLIVQHIPDALFKIRTLPSLCIPRILREKTFHDNHDDVTFWLRHGAFLHINEFNSGDRGGSPLAYAQNLAMKRLLLTWGAKPIDDETSAIQKSWADKPLQTETTKAVQAVLMEHIPVTPLDQDCHALCTRYARRGSCTESRSSCS